MAYFTKEKISSEVIAISSISDQLTVVSHIKKGRLINFFEEANVNAQDKTVTKISTLQSSGISEYLKKYKSAKICLLVYDVGMKYDYKLIQSSEAAKKITKSKDIITKNIISYTANLTPNKLTNVVVLKTKLESSKAKKNVLNSSIISFIAKNQIHSVRSFLDNVNYYTRDVYKINEQKLIVIMVYESRTMNLEVALCSNCGVISSKLRKFDQDSSVVDDVQEEIKSAITRNYRHKMSVELGIEDIAEDIYIYSDNKDVASAKFINTESRCAIQYCGENVMSYLVSQSFQYKPKHRIYSSFLDKKIIFFKIFATIKLTCALGLLVAAVVGLFCYFFYIGGNLGEYQKVLHNIEEIDKKDFSETEKRNLDTIDKLEVIEKMQLSGSNVSFINLVSKFAEVVNSVEGFYIQEYSIAKDENNYIKFNAVITISNPSGYVGVALYKISNLETAMMKNFGQVYEIKGLNFKHKYNRSKKYFKGKLSIEITEIGHKSEKIKQEKSDDTKDIKDDIDIDIDSIFKTGAGKVDGTIKS